MSRSAASFPAPSAVASARVLHDRPPPFFRRTPTAEAHDLFLRLADALPAHQSRYAEARAAAAEASLLETSDGTSDEKTLFTELQRALPGAVPQRRPDRPALLVSSTSWTEDEDFGLLVGALAALDKVVVMEPAAYPDFVVCITGKGPLRAHYEARLAELRLKRVHVRTLWLEAGDYPRLLGAADMGICLHTSSSGLDLPMKVRALRALLHHLQRTTLRSLCPAQVVDMFGASLPALAVHYPCLDELVRHGENGRVFRSATDLARDLAELFQGFPGEPAAPSLAALSRGAAETFATRWEDNWTANAAPLFLAPEAPHDHVGGNDAT